MPRVYAVVSYIISIPSTRSVLEGPLGVGPAPVPQFGKAAGIGHLPSFLLPCTQDVNTPGTLSNAFSIHMEISLEIQWNMGVGTHRSLLAKTGVPGNIHFPQPAPEFSRDVDRDRDLTP